MFVQNDKGKNRNMKMTENFMFRNLPEIFTMLFQFWKLT